MPFTDQQIKAQELLVAQKRVDAAQGQITYQNDVLNARSVIDSQQSDFLKEVNTLALMKAQQQLDALSPKA